MFKPDDPRDLAINLLPRSGCNVQVAAVVTDCTKTIIGWGWNHPGSTGLGLCAERHAIKRSNLDRLWYGYVYVAGRWRDKPGKIVTAKPCEKCASVINKFKMGVFYRDKDGKWRRE